MVRKNAAKAVQEETQKLIPLVNQSAIEVTAEEVTEEEVMTTKKVSQQKSQENSVVDNTATINKLEMQVAELKENLDASHDQEKNLHQQVVDLQSALYEKQVLIEKLTKELEEAKKAALNLAEVNSKLIAESQAKNEEKPQKSTVTKPEKASAIQVKEPYNPVGYRKSYRVPDRLVERQKPDDDFGANTWLYD
jgi:chromosome segregation ATPase